MPGNYPYFIPKNVDFGKMPRGFREAVEDIILPACQEFVVGVATSLERAAGMTLRLNVGLELLEQFEIGRALQDNYPRRPVSGVPVNATGPYRGPFLPGSLSLDRDLRLGARQEKGLKFLLQLRVARARRGTPIDGPSAVRLLSEPARQTAGRRRLARQRLRGA